MVVLNCPTEGCTYAKGTLDFEAAHVHGYSHATGACQQDVIDKVHRQKVSAESTSEDSEYFIIRCDAKKLATRIRVVKYLTS